MIPRQTKVLLRQLADRYETEDFMAEDPSLMMHLVSGTENQEDIAFLTSCLSYGQRTQFLPRCRRFISWSAGDVHQWLLDGGYRDEIPDDEACFYRLYRNRDILSLLHRYRELLLAYSSLGNYVRAKARTGLEAVKAITEWFAPLGAPHIVPMDTRSACKRICMLLRWMVRTNSPVDLGLWQDFIPRRTLIMPLDTHVVQQAVSLRLLSSATMSMSAALRLTALMRQVFPDDPTRADFALFGLGVKG